MVPVALINPPVRILPPVTLPLALANPVTFIPFAVTLATRAPPVGTSSARVVTPILIARLTVEDNCVELSEPPIVNIPTPAANTLLVV